MTDRADTAGPDGDTAREQPEITPEEAKRRFMARLSDWSEPGAITIIRNGIPLEPRFEEAILQNNDGTDGRVRPERQ
jgi:hypothetical protein